MMRASALSESRDSLIDSGLPRVWGRKSGKRPVNPFLFSQARICDDGAGDSARVRRALEVQDVGDQPRRDGPARFFGGYAGYIQADAYGGYDHLFQPRGGGVAVPTEVGCWAHARRKFVEAGRSDALRSCTAVAMIRRLYDVEAEGRELDAASRRAVRQAKSVPLLGTIKAWLDEQQGQVLPKSRMGEAIGYCLGNWKALTEYVHDGDLSPDNNAAENAIRPIVLGRKNWLFAGSDNGGRTGAVLASLVASCRRHGVDVFPYLRDVLTRIAATPVSRLDPFLPDRWKAAHATAAE